MSATTGPRRAEYFRLMNITQQRIFAATAFLGAALMLAGCSAPAAQPSARESSTQNTPAADAAESSPSASTSSAAGVPTVAGYDVGQFPPVPLFTMPDISLLDSSLAGFAIDLDKKFTPRPGLDIRPAACGDMTTRAAGRGTALLYGDGSGSYTGPDGNVVNYGDGSGSWTANGVTATVYGDGSGSYESDEMTIQNFGDGSGSVTAPQGETHVFGDGSGSFEGGGVQHWNYGDGSAYYSDGTVLIHNYGDGSGIYETTELTIANYGDGTGAVNGTAITVKPIAPEAPIGSFPPMGSIAPIASCGTTITLEDGVLFDFDKADIRPEASAVLDELAAALAEMKVPTAEVSGHTDAIGDDAYNQDLSERRASAVLTALKQRNLAAQMEATGYGETVPVAPNEVDGQDNPAGRQLNRRVEIFIPAF